MLSLTKRLQVSVSTYFLVTCLTVSPAEISPLLFATDPLGKQEAYFLQMTH